MKRLLFSLTKNDFEIQTFCTGGKGGQNQNSREKGVRIIHTDSGAVGEGREFREQIRNREAAFKRMIQTDKFKKWIKIESSRRLGNPVPETEEEIRARVDRQINEDLENGYLTIESF